MYSAKLVSALLLSLFNSGSPTNGDEVAWSQARSANTPEAYQAYLRERPNGRYIGIAYHQLRYPPSQPVLRFPGLIQLAEFCRPNDPRLACLLGNPDAPPETSQPDNNNNNNADNPAAYRGNIGMGNRTSPY